LVVIKPSTTTLSSRHESQSLEPAGSLVAILEQVSVHVQLVVAAPTRRIVEAARYVPPERLCLSPQCGFSSTVRGNEITEADQWAKLERLVEVTRQVWK
jgi:methionine synthase II (cobalamin-independent)